MTAVDWLNAEFAEEPLAWPAELPDHLSASQLSMLERCPEQFRRRYLLGEKDPPSAALVWGTVDGKAHAVANFTQKIHSHEDCHVSYVQEAFASLFDSEVDERGGASEIDWRDDKPGEIKDRGAALVGLYHRDVSPRIQPTAIEERFELAIPGIPVPFIGYIDVSTEPLSIERKTSSAQSKTIPPQYVVQTLCYALARQRPVEVHISTRTIKPAVYTPVENPGLLLEHDAGLGAQATRIIGSRARYLLSLYERLGPFEPWPDAIGTQAWHMPVCDLCGFRQSCVWWQS